MAPIEFGARADFARADVAPSRRWLTGVVVIAELSIEGKQHGPHPFLVQMRRKGKLVAGISVEDMGMKTVANDLDNARISFHQLRVPRESLLRRFAHVTVAGAYEARRCHRPERRPSRILLRSRLLAAPLRLRWAGRSVGEHA